MRKTSGLLATVAILGSALIAGPAAQAAPVSITGGGSSFAGGILTACAAAYTTNNVTYTPSSSGTGRSNFANGSTTFAGSDAAYGATDKKPAGFVYVPVIGGPVAIMFNVAGVKTLNLDAATVGKIFSGKITKWNDAAIKKLNPKAKLPDATINVNYRSSNSGTTENFTNYLAQNKAAGWSKNQAWATASGQTTPVGAGAATSSALADKVASTANSIGYADLVDIKKKSLTVAALKNGAGQFVQPTAQAAAKYLAAQSVDVKGKGIVTIDFTKKVPGAYNLSILTYMIAPTGSTDSVKAAAVKDFANYVVKSCAPAKAADLGYVALTGALKSSALMLINSID
ncbi:MAG: hypothetical protein RL645_391 [Actinomycetota bacterium]|jgi:phosphate transport system substrate-binding protein